MTAPKTIVRPNESDPSSVDVTLSVRLSAMELAMMKAGGDDIRKMAVEPLIAAIVFGVDRAVKGQFDEKKKKAASA